MRRSFGLLLSSQRITPSKIYRPRGYWNDVGNQREFLDQIIEKEQLDSDELKQKHLNTSLVSKHGGHGLIKQYTSFNDALKTIYPEVNWQSKNKLKKSELPKNSKERHRKELDEIRTKLGYSIEDWYESSGALIRQMGGGYILGYYDSFLDCICSLYPEIDWDVLKFKTKPRNFWKNIENQRLLMNQLEIQFKIKHPKDWLHINVDVFRRNGGLSLFKLYPSFIELLKAIYPNEPWETFEQRTPRGFWEKNENILNFMEDFATKMDIQEPKDWLKVSHLSIKNQPGGSGLLSFYKYSLARILSIAYPDVNWNDLKKQEETIREKPKQKINLEEARRILDEIGKEIGVKTYSDWYKVPVSVIKDRTSVIRKFSNKYDCFKTVYPEYDWNVLLFDRIPNKCWKDDKIKKQFFEYVKSELNVTTEQLLQVPLKEYFRLGGTGLMKANDSRKYDVIASVYPEIKNDETSRPDYWKSIDNQKAWIEKIKDRLDIKSPLDWSTVTIRTFTELGGGPLLNIYRTIRGILTHLYPDTDWSHLQQHLPNGYWKSHENQVQFFKDLMEKENMQHISELKNLSRTSIIQFGGNNLLSYFPSYYDCLVNVFPDEKWNVFEFAFLPRSFWENKSNHRKYLDYLASKFDIKSPEDWSKITVDIIKQQKGSHFLKLYPSFYDALQSIYPEHDWNVFESRKTVPRNYWKSAENCRAFLDDYAKRNNIKTAEDWSVKASKHEIIQLGGSGLIAGIGLIHKLKKVYPELDWKGITQPIRLSAGHWNDKNNVREFLTKFEKKYKIRKPQDWERISRRQLASEGAYNLLQKYNGIYNLLSSFYPDVKWCKKSLESRDKRATQRLLFVFLQEIFQGIELVEEFIHEGLTRELGRAVEFDVYLPKYEVGFEYHGKHHYTDIPAFGMVEMYQTRDKEKLKLCFENGVTLIVIPFWWDCSIESLRGTLSRQLADKFPNIFPEPDENPGIPEDVFGFQ